MTPQLSFVRIVSAGFLALASAALAGAQCYQFSGSGATLQITISGYNISNPPVTVAGGKVSSYVFSGSNSLTVGGSTQTSTSFLDGQISIQYFPDLGDKTPAFTQFQIVVPDGTPSAPRTGAHSWQAQLYGVGDLLPNGMPAVLPGIGVWLVPPPSMLKNFIEVDSGTSKIQYPITSVTPCTPLVIDARKVLGITCDIPGCVACGEPINVGTGNVFEQVADYRTTGLNPLAFDRYYNSMADSTALAARLGLNWRSTYDRYLRLSASSVVAERADGQEVTFTLINGAWTTDSDRNYILTNSGSTWTLTDSKDSVETYRVLNSSQALLQSIRARNGYTQTLEYDAANQLVSVADSFSRRLDFTYAGGRLATLSTPDNLVLTYGYTGNYLTSVSYNTTPVTSQTYLYENATLPSALTGIVDENGNRYVTWTYDAKGRGLSSEFAGGVELTKIAYNDTDGSRTITNALGAQTVYKFTTLQKAPKITEIDRLASGTVAAATSKFTYDSNGYTASSTDWNGVLTNYVHDVRGQLTAVVEAVGTPQARTTTFTYHPTFHLPVKVVEPGLTSTMTYDAAGNLLTTTLTDTTTTTVPYSTAGQTRTWTFTWSNFLPATIRNPRTDVAAVTQFTYDSSGAVTAVTNALGQTTQITQHLPGGLPQTIVDPNGVVTQLTYDTRLRLLSSSLQTAAGALTTSITYDAAGNRTAITLPDGASMTRTFDAAHRLTGLTDLFNQSMAITFDALDNRTGNSLLDSTGAPQRTLSSKFDVLGRVLQDVRGAGQATAYAYDANGNLLTVTDPLNRVTQKAFDPLNRLIKLTDAAKGVTTTAYDAHNRRTSVTDPNGGVTTYVYDGFGNLIQRVSPDSGAVVYRYDAAGNLTQKIDAAGAVSNHTYDALDRVLTTTYPADPAGNAAFSYDQPGASFGIGRLTGITDAAGSLTRSYDERGNVLTETRVNGAVTLTTAYTYDAANRISSIAYPSGWTVAYTRDLMGRATAVAAQPPDGSPALPVLSNVSYQPFGPVNSMTFGNGVAATRSFDQDYRLTARADAGAGPIQNLTYSYDAADNVSKIADGVTAANSQTFGYDVLNRLTAATGAYGSFSYTYDSVGNRLTYNQGGSPVNYSYAAHTNQLASVSAAGVSQTIGYTKTGHINSFNNPAAGASAGLTYNQAGHLASVTSGGGPPTRYTYDASGKRLVKTGVSTTLYQYDRRGHLLEEADDQGNPLADYIYLDDQPVAVLAPSAGQVYFLHDDRMGTPQSATDSTQAVVWTASYGPFGEMSTVPSLIVQNLRLLGQEYDADTGFYHNGFRDYAPGWGRYLQSDPIGLMGGLNTYAYAGSNPVNEIDPLGLAITDTIHNAWDTVAGWVENEVGEAEDQAQKLKKDGLSQYFDETFPETHICVTELLREAKELWDKTADIRTVIGLVKDAAEAISGEFLGVLGMASELFKHKAESGDSWGAYCNPKDTACNNYQYQQPMKLSGPTGK